MVSGAANANEAYEKIDVSAPAIVGGQVTFRITMQRNCSHSDTWNYTIQHANQLFHDDNSTIIRKDKNTYTLTLKNATSTFHKLKISFVCDQNTIDTVMLDLRGRYM